MFRRIPSRKYTLYRPERRTRSRLWSVLKFLILLVLAYFIVTHFFLQSYLVTTTSMEPTFSPGERVFSTSLSYGARVPFGGNRLPSFGSVKRGDLVIAELPFAAEKRVVADVVDDVLRFFTLQQGGLSGDELDRVGRDVLRRVVGLPGDTVRMESFVLYVRPAGKDRFVSEFETSPVRYQLNRLETPEGWTASDPFSGHMEAVELGEDEYFIAADKRNGSLDSRHFGPVSRERIQEKVILRFWPMSRFGVPES